MADTADSKNSEQKENPGTQENVSENVEEKKDARAEKAKEDSKRKLDAFQGKMSERLNTLRGKVNSAGIGTEETKIFEENIAKYEEELKKGNIDALRKSEQLIHETEKYFEATDNWGFISRGKVAGGQVFAYKRGHYFGKPALIAFCYPGGLQYLILGTAEWKYVDKRIEPLEEDAFPDAKDLKGKDKKGIQKIEKKTRTAKQHREALNGLIEDQIGETADEIRVAYEALTDLYLGPKASPAMKAKYKKMIEDAKRINALEEYVLNNPKLRDKDFKKLEEYTSQIGEDKEKKDGEENEGASADNVGAPETRGQEITADVRGSFDIFRALRPEYTFEALDKEKKGEERGDIVNRIEQFKNNNPQSKEFQMVSREMKSRLKKHGIEYFRNILTEDEIRFYQEQVPNTEEENDAAIEMFRKMEGGVKLTEREKKALLIINKASLVVAKEIGIDPDKIDRKLSIERL